MSTNRFPLFGIAEQLEKASKLEGAKEIYQKALEVSQSNKSSQIIEKVGSVGVTSLEIKKEAEEGIQRVEEKMRGKLKKIIKGKGLAIDIEVDKLIPFKEVQELIPPIDARDFNRVASDIKDRGVQVPLVVLSDTFEIICGFNRWRAAKAAGLEVVPAYIASMTREEAIKYAIKDNLNRRHLTMAEKTNLVVVLLQKRGKRTVGRPTKLEAEKIKKAKEDGFPVTIKDISEVVNVAPGTVKKVQKEIGQNDQLPKPRLYFLEKVPHKFPEVRGDRFGELIELIRTKMDVIADNLELTENDKVRAELTFFVKRKED